MLSKDAERILVKYRKYFNAFEEFDRTGKFSLEKVRRSFTIQRGNYQKLKKEAARKNTSMSELLDRFIERWIKEN
jgi:hypothetical protein